MSTAIPLTLDFSRGIDTTVTASRDTTLGIRDLVNLRVASDGLGGLEQTAYFSKEYYAVTGLLYHYSGANYSGLEFTTGVAKYATNGYLKFTHDCAAHGTSRSSLSQTQIFSLVTFPATETLYTSLHLEVVSAAGLAVTLGNNLDVEMTGAAAFRWRKNGGGWTAGVPSTSGVSIDGGNAILYFLASSGFAGTEAWSWKRTDSMHPNGNSTTGGERPTVSVVVDGQVFFLNHERALYVFKNGAITQGGYYPIYGYFLEVYEKHLIIFGATATRPTSFNSTDFPNAVVKNSDLNDYNCFFSTDVNEADTYDCNQNAREIQYAIGIAVLQNRLFLFTNRSIFVTDYLGLPVVFNYRFFLQIAADGRRAPDLQVTLGRAGVVIQTVNSFLLFDGASVRDIGQKLSGIVGAAFTHAGSAWYGFYNPKDDEYIFSGTNTSNTGIWFCWQVRYQTWYRRNPGANSGNVYCIFYDPVVYALYFGTSNSAAYVETATPTDTLATGSASIEPYVITAPIIDTEMRTYEVNEVFVTSRVTSRSVTYFTTGSGLVVKIGWFDLTTGVYPSVSTDANATWTTGSTRRLVSYPRIAGTRIALKLSLVGAGGLPPYECSLYNTETSVRKNGAVR